MVIGQFNTVNECVRQRPPKVDVIGVAFGEPSKEELQLLVFEHRMMYLLFRELDFEIGFFLLPLLDLSGDHINHFARFKRLDEIAHRFFIFADELIDSLDAFGVTLFRAALLDRPGKRVNRLRREDFHGFFNYLVLNEPFLTVFFSHPPLRLLVAHW